MFFIELSGKISQARKIIVRTRLSDQYGFSNIFFWDKPNDYYYVDIL